MYTMLFPLSRISFGNRFDVSNYKTCIVDKIIALGLETSRLCLDLPFTTLRHQGSYLISLIVPFLICKTMYTIYFIGASLRGITNTKQKYLASSRHPESISYFMTIIP